MTNPRDESRDAYAYDFGRSYAHFKRENFDPRVLLILLRAADITGGMPYEEALCGAIDELMRLWDIDRSSAVGLTE